MKTIPLTRGHSCTVDDEDGDLVNFRWFANTREKPYAARWDCSNGVANKTIVFMHRLILERAIGRALRKGELCDHIDGDKHNNSRGNLRLASDSENKCNRFRPSNNTSGYKGVSWHIRNKKWTAQIIKEGKRKHLGSFDDIEAAHLAYVEAAKEIHGNFAKFES